AQSVGALSSHHKLPPFKPGKHLGFIHNNGTLVDLNSLTPSSSGFTITDALGINDSGQILCNATDTSGYVHAVLLTEITSKPGRRECHLSCLVPKRRLCPAAVTNFPVRSRKTSRHSLEKRAFLGRRSFRFRKNEFCAQ